MIPMQYPMPTLDIHSIDRSSYSWPYRVDMSYHFGVYLYNRATWRFWATRSFEHGSNGKVTGKPRVLASLQPELLGARPRQRPDIRESVRLGREMKSRQSDNQRVRPARQTIRQSDPPGRQSDSQTRQAVRQSDADIQTLQADIQPVRQSDPAGKQSDSQTRKADRIQSDAKGRESDGKGK